ncbi:hypothetical protein MAFF241648_21250 [Ralstonia solanacearum]|nr:hypothetical protein MAFF241648_21250 [Ralstonia solanacearum]
MDYIIEMKLHKTKTVEEIQQDIQRGIESDSHYYDLYIRDKATGKLLGITASVGNSKFNEQDMPELVEKYAKRKGLTDIRPGRVVLKDITDETFHTISRTFDFKPKFDALEQSQAVQKVLQPPPLPIPDKAAQNQPDAYYQQILGLIDTPAPQPSPDDYYRVILGMDVPVNAPSAERVLTPPPLMPPTPEPKTEPEAEQLAMTWKANKWHVVPAIQEQAHALAGRITSMRSKAQASQVEHTATQIPADGLNRFTDAAGWLNDPSHMRAPGESQRDTRSEKTETPEAQTVSVFGKPSTPKYESKLGRIDNGDDWHKKLRAEKLETNRVNEMLKPESMLTLLALNSKNEKNVELNPRTLDFNVLTTVAYAVENAQLNDNSIKVLKKRGIEPIKFDMPRDFFNNTKNYETQHYFGKQSSMTTGEYRAHYAQFEKDHIVETNLVNASDIAARAMDSIHKQELQNASESERPFVSAKHKFEKSYFDWQDKHWDSAKSDAKEGLYNVINDYISYQKMNFKQSIPTIQSMMDKKQPIPGLMVGNDNTRSITKVEPSQEVKQMAQRVNATKPAAQPQQSILAPAINMVKNVQAAVLRIGRRMR